MHENTVFYQLKQNHHLPIPHCPSVKECRRCTVSGNHSSRPPCRHTASKPRSPHHQNITNWWTGVCQAHNMVLPLRQQRAWVHAWWNALWRGWLLWGFLLVGMDRSLCSGRRCNPVERWSILTSRSPQSQRRGEHVDRTGSDHRVRDLELCVAFCCCGPGAHVL